MKTLFRAGNTVGCQRDGHSSIYCDDCQVTDAADCPNRQDKIRECRKTTPSEDRYEKIAIQIAKLVSEKQIKYGDSFGQSYKIFEVLYPDGVKPGQMKEFLTIVRVVDKIFRLSRGDQGDESAWSDIMGYALLSLGRDQDA